MSLTVNFKVSGGGNSFTLDVDASLTILALKSLLKEVAKFEPDQMKIIFKGRILKDTETLESSKVESGQSMHVVKSAGATPAASSTSATAIATPVANIPAARSADGSSGAAMTAAGGIRGSDPMTALMQNPAMMQAAMQMMGGTAPGAPGAPGTTAPAGIADPMAGMMMPGMGEMPSIGMDPAMVSQMMQNPMMQQMMQSLAQNPAMMQQMIQSNPMLQQMAQNNPMMAQMLNNPQMMQMAMQMMSNPQAMQALGNMSGQMQYGGGAPGSTPGAAPGTTPSSTAVNLPTPPPSADDSSGEATTTAGGMGGGDPMAVLMQNPAVVQAAMQMMGGAVPGAPGTTAPAGVADPMAGMMMPGLGGTPSMGMDPAIISQMMQNPMMQQMMQNLAQNPAMMQQMIQSNPMLQQMAQNNPMMAQMLNNPHMMQMAMQMMSNPQAMQALGNMRGQMQVGGGAPGAAPTATLGTTPAAPNPFAAMMGAPPTPARCACGNFESGRGDGLCNACRNRTTTQSPPP